jgi:hypothetical protein
MPSFYNMELNNVKEFLSLNNLKYSIDYINGYEKDKIFKVIKQQPQAGTIISLDKINIIRLSVVKI